MSETLYIGPFAIIAALLLDLIFGDSERIIHPVVLIGRLISLIDRSLNLDSFSPAVKRIIGLAVAIILPFWVLSVTVFIIKISFLFGSTPGAVVSILLAYTTLSARGLRDAAYSVRDALQGGDTVGARKALSHIVGRDTNKLDEPEIVRGAVETVAENTSDGVIAPLFYLMIGGVPLAMAYKAVNTLDSMLAYKNERYADFGRASARLDDLANYIPARLTGLLIVVSSMIMKMDWKGAWRIMLRDGRNHPSPNAGYPEAAAAGAMNIQLGGENRYPGRVERRPHIGDKLKDLESVAIVKVVKLMYLSSISMGIVSVLLRGVVF